MCGIFGYIGSKIANDLVFDGLKRLEYRGYDSWGIAVLNKNEIFQFKDIGLVTKKNELKNLPSCTIGIGHTRWATHGGVTKVNAHPHFSTDKKFTLVQNGIVENVDQLKKELEKQKYIFQSETDTEVIVKLIEREVKGGKDFKKAFVDSFKKLEGRNTVALIDSKSKKIYAIKNGSPLVVGIGEDGTYLASDSLSFSTYTDKIIVLDDYDMIEIKENKFDVYNIKSKRKIEHSIKLLKYKYEDISKGGYEHYMLKEIVEQKKTILLATEYTQEELKPILSAIKSSRRIFLVGAGTAGYAAGQIACFLRKISGIDAQEIKSYEFRNYLPIVSSKDLIIAVSQSGETADTIECLEVFKEKGCKIVSLVNMYGTTISRMSEHEYYTNAGPEICVASTKVFTSQIAWGYLIAMSLTGKYKLAKVRLRELSESLTDIFQPSVFKYIQKICSSIKKNDNFFILGKGENFFIALEGALKIKEISYKHVEGFSAGELKHGVIALVEKGTPVIGIIPSNNNSVEKKETISAMEQVKSRGALTIGIGDPESSKLEIFDYYVSTPCVNTLSSLSNVIPFQLISYFLSLELGNSIDKPRNLAKSVTVK